MNKTMIAIAFALSAPAFAQTAPAPAPAPAAAPGFVARDVAQQQRIDKGLETGQLKTSEAARLEREQSHIDKMESNALRDGKVSPQERARINAAQNRASADIARQKHDAQRGDPNSASSRRMQADIARNVNQERRIGQGVASGQLTNHEAARLEAGQAHVAKMEARAGQDGHVGAVEQNRIQRTENRQSRHIFKEKHDEQAQSK